MVSSGGGKEGDGAPDAPAAIDFTSMFTLLQSWDADGDGLVSADDFKRGLSSIGFQISAQDADCLCRALDTDGTGNIRIDSLADLLHAPPDAASPGPPAPPTTPLPRRLPLPPTLAADGSMTASEAGEVGATLRAWEALAAADPVAAADAIAALPDAEAEALHAALGAAAADDASAPTGAAPGPPYAQAAGAGEEEEEEGLDAATLAAARSAARAMGVAARASPPLGGGGGGGGAVAAASPAAIGLAKVARQGVSCGVPRNALSIRVARAHRRHKACRRGWCAARWLCGWARCGSRRRTSRLGKCDMAS